MLALCSLVLCQTVEYAHLLFEDLCWAEHCEKLTKIGLCLLIILPSKYITYIETHT